MSDSPNEPNDASLSSSLLTRPQDSPPAPPSPPPSNEVAAAPEDWLDRPGSVDLLIKLLLIACMASVAADFFYHKHGEFHFQEYPGFDALFGFLAYVGLVNLAKGVRVLLMRSEDYYD